MEHNWVCGADDCTNIVAADRVDLVEQVVCETGKWVGTSEYDDGFDLEIKEWTGEFQTVNIASCAECHRKEQALLTELEAMCESETRGIEDN